MSHKGPFLRQAQQKAMLFYFSYDALLPIYLIIGLFTILGGPFLVLHWVFRNRSNEETDITIFKE
jgi:hypothetical protein